MNFLESSMPEAFVVKMHPRDTEWEVAFRPNRRLEKYAYTQLEMTHVGALHFALDLLNNPDQLNRKYSETFTKISVDELEAKVG